MCSCISCKVLFPSSPEWVCPDLVIRALPGLGEHTCDDSFFLLLGPNPGPSIHSSNTPPLRDRFILRQNVAQAGLYFVSASEPSTPTSPSSFYCDFVYV